LLKMMGSKKNECLNSNWISLNKCN
jgi:hypothetical protein